MGAFVTPHPRRDRRHVHAVNERAHVNRDRKAKSFTWRLVDARRALPDPTFVFDHGARVLLVGVQHHPNFLLMPEFATLAEERE